MIQSGTFVLDEDAFVKNAQSFGMITDEALVLMKLLQTKRLLENMNKNFYDL